MESKYYTPEMEEFHIGFEYEYRPWDWKNGKFLETWKDGKYRKEKSIHKIEEKYIRTLNLRTKYLDREDIEELGWIHTGGQLISEGRQDFTIDKNDTEFELLYSSINNKIVITETNYSDMGGDTISLFKGYIKNKSELKKLMKQLNIQ